MGEEGEARRLADARWVAVGTLVTDEHLVDGGAEAHVVVEADVDGGGGGGGEGKLAGGGRRGVGWSGRGAGTRVGDEAGSERDLKSEVLTGVARAETEVCREERASGGGGGDGAGLRLIACGGGEVEVAAKGEADLHASAPRVGATVDAAHVVGAETEVGVEEVEVDVFDGLGLHGALEGAEERRLGGAGVLVVAIVDRKSTRLNSSHSS